MSIGAGSQPSNFPYGFSNGAFVRGVPVEPTPSGRVLWVYNGAALSLQGRAGSDGNDGSFGSPKATIAGALLQCVAGRGDVIYVKSGHVEPTITAAAGLALNVAGVSIIGLGAGNSRPKINFGSSAAASIAVQAGGMALQNFLIDLTGVASLNAPISVVSPDFTFAGNDVIIANVTNQAVAAVDIEAGGDRATVIGNRFRGSNNGVCSAVNVVAVDSVVIDSNIFIGAFGAAAGAINNFVTAATNLVVTNNIINNLTALSTKALVAIAGTTGQLANNRIQILSGTAPFTAAGMSWVGGNYYAATIATAGTLI